MAVERSKTVAEQVNEILRERIRDKTYSPGERLPSESEFAQELGVSRATIRTVLARLAVEGLILRKQGDGTYVNERLPQVNTHLGGLWEFTHLIESSGYKASIRALSVEFRSAAASEAEALGIKSGSDVLSLERVFLADGNPVILAQNVLSAALLINKKGDINGNLHIRDFMKIYCNLSIAYAISDIRATLPEGPVSAILERTPDIPLLKLRITFYDKDNAPLIFGTSYYDDALLNLRLVQAWG